MGIAPRATVYPAGRTSSMHQFLYLSCTFTSHSSRPQSRSVIEGTRSSIVDCAHRSSCFRYDSARGDGCTLRSTSTSRYFSSPVKSSTPSRFSINYTRTMISAREAEHRPHSQRSHDDLPELRLEPSAVIIEGFRNSAH